jgi:hypothetical protein
LASTTIAIGGGTTFSATIMNPTSSNLNVVGLQGWIEQGALTVRPTGGTAPGCVPIAPLVVPPGPCVVNFSVNISNSGLGTGLLVAGAATWRLEMRVGDAVVDTKLVPVTLTTP